MPLPVIADTFRVAVEGLAPNSHKWANILHFRKTGALSYTGAIAILDPLLVTHLTTDSTGGYAWRQHATPGSSVQSIRYTPLDGTSATSVFTHVIVGAQAADPLPANIALVVTLRTALRGRSYRGRVYEACWPETENGSTGSITAVSAGKIAEQWNDFRAALSGSGVSLVVASYLHSTSEDVVQCTVDTRWDTQRRRLNA